MGVKIMSSQKNGKIAPVQNIGLTDRMVRFFGGGAVMAVGCLWLLAGGYNNLATGIILLSIYPLMTTIMGWDPLYQLFGARTCSLKAGQNVCGTFPFELDAALGNNPKPVHDYDHSLAGSHHDPANSDLK
jgi:hypothetical protein